MNQKKQNKIQDFGLQQSSEPQNSETKLNGEGYQSDHSLQNKIFPIIAERNKPQIIEIDSNSSQNKLLNQIKQVKKEGQSSLIKSKKLIKAALCGCLQNKDQSDEETNSDDDKPKVVKTLNQKLNSKKLGSYMQHWIDKAKDDKSDIEIIFDLLNNKLQEFEATIIFGSQKQHYTITNDLKVVYYDLQKKVLNNKSLTYIAVSPDCKQYFLGFSNGTVHIIDALNFQSLNLQLVFNKNWDENAVTEIIFHKKLLFVAFKDGQINIFKKQLIVQDEEKNGPSQQNNERQYVFQCQIKNDMQLEQLEVSDNGKYLVGIQNVLSILKQQNIITEKPKKQNESSSDSEISEIIQNQNEDLYKKQTVIFKIPTDGSSQVSKKFGLLNFEIQKTFIVSQQKVLLISDTMDGIDIFSLNDFEIEGYIKKMHLNIILDFLLLEDQNTLISTGKDRKVKIWDLQNQVLLQTLPVQKQVYSTIGISQDQKYLVTGGKGQIVFWYTSNWQKLCTLLQPQLQNYNTSSIQFSQSDIFLYSKDNFTKDVMLWQISDTSLTLEFGFNKIVRALMTLDNKYLMTENDQGTTILWSIDTRSILKIFIQQAGFKQEFNCTSDCKYIFFKSDDAQLVKFNLKQMKKEKIFFCNGDITFTSINSDNSIIFIVNSNKILQIFRLNQKIQEQIKTHDYKLQPKSKKKSIFDIKYQKDSDFIQEIVFNQNYDKINDVEEKEYFPTFALSDDDKIIMISVDGEQTFILNISNPQQPRILFKNRDDSQQTQSYFEYFYQEQTEVHQQFKNIKSFTFDHSGDQVILVYGKKAVVLQLCDDQNKISKIQDLIEHQNQNEDYDNQNFQQDFKYRYRQTQVLFKLSQEDNFYAYYVEKESLVLTKLNKQWTLWSTKIYDNWNKILEFEGDYKVIRGKNRMLIGLIDENDQIKYISRKLFTDLSGLHENFIQNLIKKYEIIQFLKDHLHRSTKSIRQNIQSYDWKSYEENMLKIVGQFQTTLEKHHILYLGKIRTEQIVMHDKRINERIDYDQQRRVINKLYPNKNKKNTNLSNRSYFKQSMIITGPINYLYPYILTEMIKDQANIINYIEALKKNNIFPFNINILHYFTYQNQIHCMNACLDQGIKYNRDKFDNTPLAYALKRKSTKSIENILMHAADHNHLEIIQSITQNEICQLIEQSPQKLVPFLEKTYQEIQEDIPVFGIIKSSGILGSSNLFFLEDRVLLDKKDADQYYSSLESKQQLPIVMKTLLFKYNFTLGSKESLEYHWALENCRRQVFQCTPVQKLIQYKWQQLKNFAQLQFLITLAYCIILILHLYNLDQQNYQIAICVFCFYFLVFEMVSILSGDFNKIMQDIWSYFDLTFLVLQIIYIIFELGLKNIIVHQKYLLAVLNLISWLRCCSQLRGFKSSRMFIKQVVQIIFDLKSFMIVLIGSILTVASTYTMLTNDPSESDYQDGVDYGNYLFVVWEYVFQQFPPAYGPQYEMAPAQPINSSMTNPTLFPLDGDISFQLVLHFFAQIFISLIMMNLVIAIINDTLQKSMENSQNEDFKELNNMILYYEKFYFWRKQLGSPQYLHWLEYGDNQADDQKANEEQSQIELQLNQINDKIDRIIEENIKDRMRIESTEKNIVKLCQMNDKMFFSKKIERNDSIEKDYNQIITNRNKK